MVDHIACNMAVSPPPIIQLHCPHLTPSLVIPSRALCSEESDFLLLQSLCYPQAHFSLPRYIQVGSLLGTWSFPLLLLLWTLNPVMLRWYLFSLGLSILSSLSLSTRGAS